MAAKKQQAPCMFCGGMPCQCPGSQSQKKRSAKIRTPSRSVEFEPISNSVDTDSDTTDRFGSIPERVKPKFKSAFPVRDLSYESALRNIRGLVHPSDVHLIDDQLAKISDETAARIAAWRNYDET